MYTIKFSEPWDKLQPPRFSPGEKFTTMRGYRPDRQMYYKRGLDKTFSVDLDKMVLGYANLYTMDYRWAAAIEIEFIQDDTYKDYTRIDFENLMIQYYGNPNPYLIILYYKVTGVNNLLHLLEPDLFKKVIP